jgi:hypothetical protein
VAIAQIEIRNFRGIASGTLTGLRAFTILTGANGSGKSAVLDGLSVLAGSRPVEALIASVQRRRAAPIDPRWLFHRDEREAFLQGPSAWRTLRLLDGPPPGGDAAAYSSHVRVWAGRGAHRDPDARAEGWLAAPGHASGAHRKLSLFVESDEDAHLVDPSQPTRIEDVFSDAVRAGSKAHLEGLLASLIPGFRSLDILTESDGPALYVASDPTGLIPVGLSGDGIQALVQLAVHLAAKPRGLVLIEEPEVYQHPRALFETARACWAAIDRGTQVIATTHSMDFLDAVVQTADEGREKPRIERLAVFNLALEAGRLRSGEWLGPDARAARTQVELDLR